MLTPKSSEMFSNAHWIAAAVKVAIIAWKATRVRFRFFYMKERLTIKGLRIWMAQKSHPPSRPIVRICIVHVGDRIQIQGSMPSEKILTMLFGKMCDSIFNIKVRVFARFHPLRNRRGTFNVLMLARFLHLEYIVRPREPRR